MFNLSETLDCVLQRIWRKGYDRMIVRFTSVINRKFKQCFGEGQRDCV